MKLLLDHNLDRRLRQYFPDRSVSTAFENGWANARNGELLRLAESNGFDVLLTADANIKDQQNISGRSIAVLIFRSFNNRLVTHREMIGQVAETLTRIQPGQIVEVFHHEMRSPN
ncbi:MAG: DUF5615 family PIN-like protein [Pyrinomonadaceae bacterium]